MSDLTVYGVAVVILAAAITWAALIQSVTLCPSCPALSGPCPCVTDHRIGLRALIIAGGLILAMVVARLTRRRERPHWTVDGA